MYACNQDDLDFLRAYLAGLVLTLAVQDVFCSNNVILVKLTLCAPELHSYGNWFDSMRPQSHFFTILPILHKTLVTVTKVFHGCTDHCFTLSGVTFHAKHAKLKHAKLFIEHNIFE